MKGRYSPLEQRGTVSRWLIGQGGRRPSEAAMEVTAMSLKKLRVLHKNIRYLLDEGELEQVQEQGTWVIREKKVS